MAEIINAFANLLDVLLKYLGPIGTIIAVVLFLGITIIWKIYNEKQQEKEINLVLQEKERALQRAVNEAREWRIHFLKQHGWTEEQIQLFVIRADFEDGPSSREHLEKQDKDQKNDD